MARPRATDPEVERGEVKPLGQKRRKRTLSETTEGLRRADEGQIRLIRGDGRPAKLALAEFGQRMKLVVETAGAIQILIELTHSRLP